MKNGCIIGYGAVAPNHAAALYENNRLYGVCDIDESRLKRCEYGGVKKFSDYRDVLEDSNVDVIHICTPHYLHAKMALDAIQHKKDIILEKPAAMTMPEFNKLLDFSKNFSNKICVMLQNRTNPCIAMLKEIILSGTYGKILSCCGFLTWCRDAAYYRHDTWRGKLKTEGGGLLINQAIHLIDICGWLCGGIKSVRGSISTKVLGDVIEVEDTADAVFETNSGARICFYATNCNAVNSPMRLELNFKDVTFRYSDGNLYKIQDGICETVCSDSKSSLGKSYWGKGHFDVINSFYDYIENGTGSYISLSDSANSMRALFSFYESAKTNKTITLQED